MILLFIIKEAWFSSFNREPLNSVLLLIGIRISGICLLYLIMRCIVLYIFPLDVEVFWLHMFRSALVERMPALDEATYSGRRAGSVPSVVSTSQAAPLNLPNGVAKASAAPLIDLLDLSSDDVPAPSSSGGDFLQDLLGVDLAPASQSGDIIHFCILFLPIDYCLSLLGSDKREIEVNQTLLRIYSLLFRCKSDPENWQRSPPGSFVNWSSFSSK